ncbi:RipA family octameric membrane protein [Streptomyces ardesiacus]|uniref:RipA family octameric membrane protein n=1 Tax=Streptomyces ardesiacus TaxID=285564 RepID=UPI00364B6946
MSDALDELRSAVWNPSFPFASPPAGSQDIGSQFLFEQYKLYVEMTDRMSARRALTNSFFLTINLAALGAVGSLAAKHPRDWSAFVTTISALALIAECFVWFYTLRSYRQLSNAKYTVIGVLEEKLPSRPYSKGEWGAYIRSGKQGKYFRLTTAEQMMPLIFGIGYLAMFLYSLLK